MGNFRKLGRHSAHRVSMLRTMVSQLVKHERIETTVAKAKEVRRKADQMVQLGKDVVLGSVYIVCRKLCRRPFMVGADNRYADKQNGKIWTHWRMDRKLSHRCGCLGTLDAARCASAFVRGDDVVHKLFTELAYRYKDRAGGYTRLLRTRIRIGDAAPMAYIEFVDRENELREAKPATPQPPQRAPLDPWSKSRVSQQWAGPKVSQNSKIEGI